MNTNQFWTPETIKAVGGLWPLALVVLFILVLLTIVIFFRPQTRAFLDRLQNLMIRRGKTEISLNQPPPAAASSETAAKEQETAPSPTKKEGNETKQAPQAEQPELNLDPKTAMYYHAWSGENDKLEEAFQKLQAQTKDPEERIQNEALFLKLRFENGDETAHKKLHQLEVRAKEFPKTLGVVKRTDAECYVFSRNFSKAAERFQESAESCVTEAGKALSISEASIALYESGLKADAFALLRKNLEKLAGSEARVTLYVGFATLFEREQDHFNRAVVLQRALQLQPNSKDLNFKTAYAFGEAEFNALAVLHYEKLIEMDFKHANALNNLGVAFKSLGAPTLAVKYYKKAIELGETLSASNFAHILIDAGAADEAAEVLKKAQAQKEIHENVNQALVKVDAARKEGEATRSKNLELAKSQHQFFLGYADALLRIDGTPKLDGVWIDMRGKAVELKADEANQIVEVIWSGDRTGYLGPITDKFKFTGKLNRFVATGDITIFEQSMATFLTKADGTFTAYGSGYAYFKGHSELKLFLQKTVKTEFELLSFKRSS